ncbi:hypothetical protein ACJX0J_032602, partial [Zea mays]
SIWNKLVLFLLKSYTKCSVYLKLYPAEKKYVWQIATKTRVDTFGPVSIMLTCVLINGYEMIFIFLNIKKINHTHVRKRKRSASSRVKKIINYNFVTIFVGILVKKVTILIYVPGSILEEFYFLFLFFFAVELFDEVKQVFLIFAFHPFASLKHYQS